MNQHKIALRAAKKANKTRSQRARERAIKSLEQYALTIGDTIYEILACWLCGALLVAYLATWFMGCRFVPPDEKLSKTPLSIQSILTLTFVAALAFYFIRAQNPANRMLYFANGATVGVLASVSMWSVFQPRVWKKVVPPLLAVAAVIFLDLVLGGMLSAWRGTVSDRAEYVVRFAGGLVVSPTLTAIVLQKAGYRLAH